MPELEELPKLSDTDPYKPAAVETAPVSDLDVTYDAPERKGILSAEVAPEYVAPERYVPPEEATVEGRLTGILAGGGKYLAEARQRGKEYGHSRGLLSSSIAAGATEREAIRAALPIAQQDAATAAQADLEGYRGEIAGAGTTQKFKGESGIIGVQAQASSDLLAEQGNQDAAITTLKGEIASGLSAQDAEQRAYQSKYDSVLADGLGEREAERQAIRSAQDAAQNYKTAVALTKLEGDIQSGLSSQRSLENMALATHQGSIQSGLSKEAAVAATLLATHKGAIQSGLSEQDAQQAATLATLQASLSEGIINFETLAAIEIDIAKGLVSSGLSEQQAQQNIALAREQAGLEEGLIAERAAADVVLEQVRQAGANHRQDLENTLRETLAASELTSIERRAASDSIARLGDSYMEQISNVQRDPNVSASSKTAVIRQIREQHEQNMQNVADMYGIGIVWGEGEVVESEAEETEGETLSDIILTEEERGGGEDDTTAKPKYTKPPYIPQDVWDDMPEEAQRAAAGFR